SVGHEGEQPRRRREVEEIGRVDAPDRVTPAKVLLVGTAERTQGAAYPNPVASGEQRDPGADALARHEEHRPTAAVEGVPGTTDAADPGQHLGAEPTTSGI